MYKMVFGCVVHKRRLKIESPEGSELPQKADICVAYAEVRYADIAAVRYICANDSFQTDRTTLVLRYDADAPFVQPQNMLKLVMILDVEKRAPLSVDSFSKVERALRKLKSYGPMSFASLTAKDGSYVQVAGGRVTCILEYKTSNSKALSRAYFAEKRAPFDGIQTLMCGAGHIQMMPDEILFIEDVIAVFKAFYLGEDFPREVLWRKALVLKQ